MNTTTELKDISIDDIHLSEHNPKQLIEEGDQVYEKLKRNLDEFNLVSPIIINTANGNKVIDGHQRLVVLRDKGVERLKLFEMGDVGWAFVDDELHIKSEAHERALRIALDKIRQEFEPELLDHQMTDLSMENIDMDLTGFEPGERESFGAFSEGDELDLDSVDIVGESKDEKDVLVFSFSDTDKLEAVKEKIGISDGAVRVDGELLYRKIVEEEEGGS